MRCYLLFLFGLATGLAQDFPKTPPELESPHAGADVIFGKSSESAWPVRIKVFDSAGHIVQQRDVFVNGSDSSIVAGFPASLQAGQIVQAYFLRGATEIMPSAPLLVGNAASSQLTAVRIRGELAPGATNVYVEATPTLPKSGHETHIYSCPDGVPAGIRDSSGFKPYAVTDASGQAAITFEQPLAAGQSVSLCQKIVDINDLSTPAIEAPGSGAIAIANPLDLGRVHYYFTAGVILSNDQGFQLNSPGTQADLFLDLNADRAWLPLDSNGFRRINVNTYLDIALTSVPAGQAQAGNTLDSFIQSQKAATFQGGAYLPLIVGQPWSTGGSRYSLFVAPLAEAGFTTPTSGASEVFFESYSFGARLGVFQHSRSAAQAPELVSYVDITRGRFGNFGHPWRYSLEGVFKVPHSPLVLGFNANIGTGGTPGFVQPRDDLRFLIGAQFDFSKLLKALPAF
ncbi:MAG TPA: hypothetical protein VLW25_08870 [Bryobacteraceae bacterium]|nr:hypothetical protein [Bryobacteraceae bacterium]